MPVWMSADVVDGYYNGFANGIVRMPTLSICDINTANSSPGQGVLWPLFHYRENFKYEDAWYDHYVTANQLFADAVAKVWFLFY